MHKRGIVVLPGGDYGFAWTPHGTYARDLEHFVKLLGFTPHEAIIAATAGVAKLFMRRHELGAIKEGYYADCILVNGNPLEDIKVLQDHDKLNVICINGRVHKAGRQEYVAPLVAGQNGNIYSIVPDFPEVKREMQKNY
jgi:imidazolonepropionase-like amidohydrolase